VLGYEVARIIGAELAHGFITTFARFDLAQMLDLCWRIGSPADDPLMAEGVDFVGQLQGPNGLWEYAARPQASRWVTFDLLRSLLRLKGGANRRSGSAWNHAHRSSPTRGAESAVDPLQQCEQPIGLLLRQQPVTRCGVSGRLLRRLRARDGDRERRMGDHVAQSSTTTVRELSQYLFL